METVTRERVFYLLGLFSAAVGTAALLTGNLLIGSIGIVTGLAFAASRRGRS